MPKRIDRDDAGFSMVEIVVAMLLFALLSVAVIPLIIGITVLTANNRDIEDARASVASDIAQLREQYPSDPAASSAALCSALDTYGFSPTPSDIGNGLTVKRTADACPSTFPGAVAVHYEVARGGDVLSTFDTSIRVEQ